MTTGPPTVLWRWLLGSAVAGLVALAGLTYQQMEARITDQGREIDALRDGYTKADREFATELERLHGEMQESDARLRADLATVIANQQIVLSQLGLNNAKLDKLIRP